MDGFTRSLAVETAPFGIRTMVVEPSGFATDWAGSSMTVHEIPEDYDATIGTMQRLVRTNPSGPAGDPHRAADIIVRIAQRDTAPSHLLLGVNAVDMALKDARRKLAEATTWQAVGRSADFTQSYPIALPTEENDIDDNL